jgi:hypothetical protein
VCTLLCEIITCYESLSSGHKIMPHMLMLRFFNSAIGSHELRFLQSQNARPKNSCQFYSLASLCYRWRELWKLRLWTEFSTFSPLMACWTSEGLIDFGWLAGDMLVCTHRLIDHLRNCWFRRIVHRLKQHQGIRFLGLRELFLPVLATGWNSWNSYHSVNFHTDLCSLSMDFSVFHCYPLV